MGRLAIVAVFAAGCLGGFDLDGADGGAAPKKPAPGAPGSPDPDGTDAGAAVVDAAIAPMPDLRPPPPDLAVDVAAVFAATVQPLLVGADGKSGSCGGCHDKSGGIGPGFFEPHPDVLTTMLAYPGLVGETPDRSRLYAKGAHEGPALTAVEKPIVADWINLYNAHKPPVDAGATKPTVKPFAPVMGANTVDLSVLDATLAGQSLTFTAKMIGATSLELSAITVHTAASGVHIVHPLFVTWDAMMNATPDPVDSFSNLDETVAAADNKPLGPGTLLLPNFSSTALVNVVFATIEAKMAAPDGGGGTLGCKNVSSYQTNAKPQLMASCTSCHGNAGSSAGMAFNLATLGGMDAAACQTTLGEVNTATPATSRLFTYPDPGQPGNGHPFHFADTATYTTFKNDVGVWIATEK